MGAHPFLFEHAGYFARQLSLRGAGLIRGYEAIQLDSIRITLRSVVRSFRMLSNLIQLISRRPPAGFDHGFIKHVEVSPRRRVRSRKMDRLILFGWLLIAVKSGLIVWAVREYRVPVDPLWVIAPTVLFALVCTLVYFRGE